MSVQCYKERIERLTQRFFGFFDDFQGMIGDFVAEFARFIVIPPEKLSFLRLKNQLCMSYYGKMLIEEARCLNE